MPHLRKRHLENAIRKASTFSPLVGILGHRQSGKTVLSGIVSENYHTFDDFEEIAFAQTDPKSYLSKVIHAKKNPCIIDECQLVPAIFPALKNWVRVHPKPGQFILTGSIRFTSMEAISESLTGRIINLELYPMIVSELQGRELPTLIRQATERESLDFLNRSLQLEPKQYRIRTQLIEEYMTQGGLPGVCFIRNAALRSKKHEQQLFTMLDRDLRKVVKTNLTYPVLRSLVSALARQQGEALNLKKLQEETQISVPTLKKLIFGLHAIYLIRTIPIEGGRKGQVILFEDMGECSLLRKGIDITPEQSLTHFAYLHFRAQFDYELDEPTTVFQYHSKGGAFVPLVFQNSKGTLGIIVLDDFKNHQASIQSANSLLKSYPKSKVIMIHSGTEEKLLQGRIRVCPIAVLV